MDCIPPSPLSAGPLLRLVSYLDVSSICTSPCAAWIPYWALIKLSKMLCSLAPLLLSLFPLLLNSLTSPHTILYLSLMPILNASPLLWCFFPWLPIAAVVSFSEFIRFALFNFVFISHPFSSMLFYNLQIRMMWNPVLYDRKWFWINFKRDYSIIINLCTFFLEIW